MGIVVSIKKSVMNNVMRAGMWVRFPEKRNGVEGCLTKRISAPWCASIAGLAKGLAWLSNPSVSLSLSRMDSEWLGVESGWAAVAEAPPADAPRLEWQSMKSWRRESCAGMEASWSDASGARRDACMDGWREAGIYWDKNLGGWMTLSYIIKGKKAGDGECLGKSKIDYAKATPMALTIWHWDHDILEMDWRIPELGDRDLLAMCEGMGAGILDVMQEGLSTAHAKPSQDCLLKIQAMGRARRERRVLDEVSAAGSTGQGAVRV